MLSLSLYYLFLVIQYFLGITFWFLKVWKIEMYQFFCIVEGQTILTNLWGWVGWWWGGVVLRRRTTDRIIPRWEERLINAFSSNLNPVDLKIFPNHSGIFISRWSRHNSIELWKDLFLRYIVKKFWRVCHVQFPSCWTWPGLLIHYLKINTRNSELNLKKHFVHYVSGGGYYMQSLPSFLISLLVVCC